MYYAGSGYVGYGFGKAKVLLEAAYIDQDNSITSTKDAFNQKTGSKMYSVGLTGRLGLKAGNFDITPSVGVRVSKLKSEAMHSGNVEIGKQSQTLVQVPLALRVKTQTQTASGWTVEPNMRVAFVPTFGDKSIRIMETDQRVLDSRPLQGDLGLTLRKGNFQMDATFSYGGGSQGMSSVGGKVGVKYLF